MTARSPTHDIATLVAWAEAGAPEGDPADLPPPAKFPDDWTMEGGPDLVLDIGADFEIPATGRRRLPLLRRPDEPARGRLRLGDRVPARQPPGRPPRPGLRRNARARPARRTPRSPGPGYTCFSGPGVQIHGDLGGWAPGNQPSQLPDGIGRSLPKDADVVIQVHYHPSGKPEIDRTRIGLRFARKPVRQTLHWNAAPEPGDEAAAGRVEHRGQGRLEGARRRDRPRRRARTCICWARTC